jgi:hypothetical protein
LGSVCELAVFVPSGAVTSLPGKGTQVAELSRAGTTARVSRDLVRER